MGKSEQRRSEDKGGEDLIEKMKGCLCIFVTKKAVCSFLLLSRETDVRREGRQ